MFIVGWGTELGFSVDETTLMVSMIGFGNIIGRPTVAYVSDLFSKHRIPMTATLMLTNGLIAISTRWFSNFYFLTFFTFQYAFLLGGTQALMLPVLTDFVPIVDLPQTFSLSLTIEGVAAMIGPPILALLPSYFAAFAVSGCICIAGAFILLTLFYVGEIGSFVGNHFHIKPRSIPEKVI